jgi:FdhE protein
MRRKGDGSNKPEGKILGSIARPPFVRLPEPDRIFAHRAARYRQHAPGSPLGPYLELLAGISDLQARLATELPPASPPDAQQLERAATHSMPPLDRNSFQPDAAFDQTLEQICEGCARLEMPAEARAALQRVILSDRAARRLMVRNVLADAIPFEAIAEHVFVAAAVQLVFARLAATLDPATLKPIGDGVCPCCGGAPVASLIVDWPQAHGTRFIACGTCSTLWNYVRAKCTLCGSTREITFREVEGGGGTVKAEACESCRGYVKVLYQDRDSSLDPVADDVATLGLDLLVKELGYHRGGVNPFLIGY